MSVFRHPGRWPLGCIPELDSGQVGSPGPYPVGLTEVQALRWYWGAASWSWSGWTMTAEATTGSPNGQLSASISPTPPSPIARVGAATREQLACGNLNGSTWAAYAPSFTINPSDSDTWYDEELEHEFIASASSSVRMFLGYGAPSDGFPNWPAGPAWGRIGSIYYPRLIIEARLTAMADGDEWGEHQISYSNVYDPATSPGDAASISVDGISVPVRRVEYQDGDAEAAEVTLTPGSIVWTGW